MMFQILIENESENSLVVDKIKPYLKPKSLFLLTGDLGAGKTTFVKALFPECDIISPTFSIRNSYLLKSGLTLEHFDLYRMENENDVESIGFWDVFSQEKSTIFIEWPERVESSLWPLDWDRYLLQILVMDSNVNKGQRNFILSQLV